MQEAKHEEGHRVLRKFFSGLVGRSWKGRTLDGSCLGHEDAPRRAPLHHVALAPHPDHDLDGMLGLSGE